MKTLEELRDEIVRTSLADWRRDNATIGGAISVNRTETYAAWWIACEAYEQARKPPTVEEVLDAVDEWNKNDICALGDCSVLGKMIRAFRARLAASKEAKT